MKKVLSSQWIIRMVRKCDVFRAVMLVSPFSNNIYNRNLKYV